MTREEIMQLNTDYLNDCESEHEMNELFYFVLELLKHEQESSCPYYVIDEDGHGLCKNHRLEQEPILDKIRAEIEQTVSRYSISRERGAMGQVEWSDRLIKESEVLEIIDKYKAESEPQESEG